METVTVHTTQNIDIDYELGSIGERMVAALIDYGILIPPFLIIGIILGSHISRVGVIVMVVLFVAIYTFYDLICETFFNGQSFGKKVMKVRVISLDGGRPRFSQFLLRWLFRLVDFTLTGWVVGLISAIVTDKTQRVGDIVAGTIIIRTVPRTKMNNVGYIATPQEYEPVFPQAAQLSDSDVALIHEVIGNYMKTGNNVSVYQLADRIREHLNLTIPPSMNSMVFLQTLLKDHSHITSSSDLLINN